MSEITRAFTSDVIIFNLRFFHERSFFFFSVTMVQTIIAMLTWKFRETLTNSIHLAVARDIVRGKREVFGGWPLVHAARLRPLFMSLISVPINLCPCADT